MCYRCVKNSIHFPPCKIKCLSTSISKRLFGFTCQPLCNAFLGRTWRAHPYGRGFGVGLAMLRQVWLLCSSSPPRRPSSVCCKERIFTCLNTSGDGRVCELTKTVDQIQFYSYGRCLVQNNILDIQLKWEKLLFFFFFFFPRTSYLLQFACYLYF